MAQLKKPGRLSMQGFQINMNAMKPGAVNPLIQKKRRASATKVNIDTTAKLNQVTIKTKRRKSKRRKSKQSLLNNTDDDEKINNQNRMSLLINPLPSMVEAEEEKEWQKINKIQIQTPGGSHATNSDKKFFGEGSKPQEPMPTPPPPPPPINTVGGDNGEKYDKTPPPPAPPVLASINKKAKETEHSTTFTVSGYKITIIGHARTGKTSLKDALFGREFKDMTFPTVKPSAKPTIIHKHINIHTVNNNDDDDEISMTNDDDLSVNVEYEIWDTPGQKALEYIPPLYITGSFAVFIVYDITDQFSWQRAQYWLNYLEDVAKGYDNVVLIGNKYDIENERCIKSDDAQMYADKHGIFFIEMSVKTKHNFEILVSWLNQKTQEKISKEIQDEKLNNNNNQDDDDEKRMDNASNKKSKKKDSKKKKKTMFEQHQRNNQTIQLDKIDIHSRDKSKSRSCCLW